MKFKNYLLDLIRRDRNVKPSSDICINGTNKIIKESYIDIKRCKPNIKKFMIKNLKSPANTIYCWMSSRNPIPIPKLYILLNIWKKICKKTNQEFEEKWDKIFITNKGFSVHRGKNKAILPMELTEDLSYLTGFILADGYLKDENKLLKRYKFREYSIVICDNSKEHVEYLKEIVTSIFKTKCNIYFTKDKKGSWYILRCTSKPVFRFFSDVLKISQGDKTGKIRVPELIKKSNFNLQKAFIAGFSDGEAGVGISTKNPWLEIAQKSIYNKPPLILLWIQEKLKKTNINLNGPHKMSKLGNCWRLRTASKKTINLFYQEIPVRHIDKVKAYEEIRRFSYAENRS
ncbi:MAG: hypothetical protein ABIH63_04600 [archaeon]